MPTVATRAEHECNPDQQGRIAHCAPNPAAPAMMMNAKLIGAVLVLTLRV